MKMKEPIARNDELWQGHPDVTFYKDYVYIVYRESDKHLTSGTTRIKLIKGKITEHDTLSYANVLTVAESTHRLNCPRISVVDDKLWIVCDEIQSGAGFISAENDKTKTHIIIWQVNPCPEHGVSRTEPIHTNIQGIVPDRLRKFNDKYLIAVHTKEHGKPVDGKDKDFSSSYDREQSQGRLVQKAWTTDDPNLTSVQLTCDWEEHVVSDQEGKHLCEGSIFENPSGLYCLMRENSGKGLPGCFAYSADGENWTGTWDTRLFGCHRPVWGALKSKNILVTYREQSSVMSPECWARNTFAAIIPRGARVDEKAIILPLDHDRSKKPDGGYTGWVQLPDDRIFVVNYITDDAPKPYIRGYLLHEEDF